MDSGSDDSAGRSRATTGELAPDPASEVSLYEDLMAFSTLSSEEKRDEMERASASVPQAPPPVESASDSVSIDESNVYEVDATALEEERESVVAFESRARPNADDADFAFWDDQGSGPLQVADESSKNDPGNELAQPGEDPEVTVVQCSHCGAGSHLEDLFCSSCSELLVEVDW